MHEDYQLQAAVLYSHIVNHKYANVVLMSQRRVSLKDNRTKYAKVAHIQIPTHICINYGVVDLGYLTAKESQMKPQWSPPVHIETLFTQFSK